MLGLPPLPLCHEGHLWGSVVGFQVLWHLPKCFCISKELSRAAGRCFGRQIGYPGEKRSTGLMSVCLRFLSCKRSRVSPSHGQFKKNKAVNYYRKSLNRQHYGSVQTVAFRVLMSLSCAFLDINAGRVCGREVLCIYSFASPVRFPANICSQLQQAIHSPQAFRNSSFLKCSLLFQISVTSFVFHAYPVLLLGQLQ